MMHKLHVTVKCENSEFPEIFSKLV